MNATPVRPLLVLGSLAMLLFGVACSTAKPTPTPTSRPDSVSQSTQTASYRIRVVIGPVVTMPSPDPTQTVNEGDAAEQLPGMSVTDQGRPVNHHLEVHIYDGATGAVVTDVRPTVNIMEPTMRISRVIGTRPESVFLLACKLTKHLLHDLHFGDNLYLPDGNYTIAVDVDNEKAVVEGLVITAVGSSAP